MFSVEQLSDLLFLDIETASLVRNYSELPETLQKLWLKKAKSLKNYQSDEIAISDFQGLAGLFAEFGRVVCISCGYLKRTGEQFSAVIKSFYGTNEKQILQDFASAANQFLRNKPEIKLCGHNIKEFDVPYICRRTLINGLPLANLLQLEGKKPWEVPHIDTMNLWKFGDNKSWTGLELLAAVFEIPSPKNDLNGSEVSSAFWNEQAYDRIASYCQSDVVTTMQLMLRYSGLPILRQSEVEIREAVVAFI
ncbi:MAG: ribonuclease H-like domain-containing protein [Bacteroidia bacterium]|nr:ribonuclease H-like domain-containing protein [Bacteroidia bacterium]